MVWMSQQRGEFEPGSPFILRLGIGQWIVPQLSIRINYNGTWSI